MNKTTLSLAIAGLLLSAGAVSAADPMDFDVSAEVIAACVIESADALEFANFNPVSGEAVDNNTTVRVRCTTGAPYDIGLNVGLNADGTSRRMKISGEEEYLGYELYSNSPGGLVWGNTEAVDRVNADGNGAEQEYTVYGRIAAGQPTAKLGLYADTITVSVTY